MTNDPDDAELVRDAVSGDPHAFEILVRRHGAVVRSVCGKYLRSADDIDDAIQDTLFRAYRALPRLTYFNIPAWFGSIARNVCIDKLRLDTRRPPALPLFVEVVSGAEPGPEETVAGGDPRIDVALSALSDHHRAVVEMRFVHEMSHREMGALMRKSASQVKALVHRAKRALKIEWAAA